MIDHEQDNDSDDEVPDLVEGAQDAEQVSLFH
jgi:hypothetical protein